MTTTCLPAAAYYHINRNTEPVKPRFRENHTLPNYDVATQRELEAAFRLTFGDSSFDEDFACIDWTSDPTGDAKKFMDAFSTADQFVWSVMHRLYPYQQYEMIPALTHALMSWCQRRHASVPESFNEQEAINLLNWSGYDDMSGWLKQQQ